MADDRRTIKLGDIAATLTDPDNVQIALVEAVAEVRTWNGVIALTLGTVSNEGADGPPEVRVCARLRIPLPAAEMIAKILQDVVGDATPTKQTLN